jgi:hypothetical protein
MDKEPGMIQMIQAEFSLHLNITQSASASGNTGPNPSTSTTNAMSRDNDLYDMSLKSIWVTGNA